MKTKVQLIAVAALFTNFASSRAATHYVDLNSLSPAAPFTNWITAAHVIQDAVDAALAGDEVVVTNGLYATGGRVAGANPLTNRVAVDKPLTVRSVNGPEVTVLRGYQGPGTGNGYSTGAVRCVYLANGASLAGFTLTNGAADDGGGVWAESTTAMVSNCVIVGNTAEHQGAGASSGTLNNCLISGNSAWIGGGAFASTLNNCTLSGNHALYTGYGGGGACSATLNGCTVVGNSSAYEGGGADQSTLNNCFLGGNSAFVGGGAHSSTLSNCTLIGNSAGAGGGVGACVLANSIVYYNVAQTYANYDPGSSLSYCCTTPLPGSGVGDFSSEPQMASSSHISAGSPCRGAGNSAYASGVDIDGEPWANPPSVGCDEFYPSGHTGPLTVAIQTSATNVAPGFQVNFVAQIDGNVSTSAWDFGDGTVVSNRPYAAHAWQAAGDYALVLRAYNQTYPTGVSASVTVHIIQAVHHVAVNSTNPTPPYSSWATAATTIQDAVDAATVIGALVLVTNGSYAVGGRAESGTVTNRVALDRPLTLRSVNGPGFTIIDGGTGLRCAYLASGATLSGFTLTNGVADIGGGVLCDSTNALVSNCVLTGNSSRRGGGSYQGTLINCILSNNLANSQGGGASESTLSNCVLTGNSAVFGGGASFCTLNSCTLKANFGASGGGAFGGTLNSCTLSDNSAYEGGGASASVGGCDIESPPVFMTLNNCALTDNRAYTGGGGFSLVDVFGVDACPREVLTLNNCSLSGNSAHSGGGVSGCTLNNCTLTGNSATNSGGGAAGFSSLHNCISYFNNAPTGANYDYGSCTLNYCCTTPLPKDGSGNIASDPRMTDAAHLGAYSPCVAAGSAAYTQGEDIDGQSWADPPSIGCDEFYAGSVTGLLTVAIGANATNVATGFQVTFSGEINGHATASFWDFGDGTFAIDEGSGFVHSFTNPGNYPVVLRAYNDSFPGGVSATLIVHVLANAVYYVASASTNPVSPYSSWVTAAASIQDALDVAVAGGTVLVTNGVYAAGGRPAWGSFLTNRVVVDKPLTLRSVNGPLVTIIRGYQIPGTTNGDTAIRCVYLRSGAALTGFTLENGATLVDGFSFNQDSMGAGLWCDGDSASVSNCLITSNSAWGAGGGASGGRLYNCTIANNSAWHQGGGAYGSTLSNCLLTGNLATIYAGSDDGSGGGASSCTLQNCLLIANSAEHNGGGAYLSTLQDCLLTGNSAKNSGGGVCSSTLKNCTVSTNSAGGGGGESESTLWNCLLGGNSAGFGGAAFEGTLINCAIAGNRALGTDSVNGGGGAEGSALYSCTLIGNSAANSVGGGAVDCSLNNCILYFNTAARGANFPEDHNSGLLDHCCTTPQPTNGFGNITNAPLFVDLANGNLRLQINSPCINAGDNSYLANSDFTNSFDLDGNPRIAGGTVDIGAYEFQNPASIISYAWLQQYGLRTDGTDDFKDPDGDGMNNWQEWRCRTNPTNSQSALRIISALPTGTNVTVSWQSVAGVNYFLERSANLLNPAPVFTPVAAGIPGQDGTTSYSDTNAFGTGPFFYRIVVGY